MEGEKKDSISISDPSVSQTSTLLAYRPRYNDMHDSNLAGLFVNIQQVFTCTSTIPDYVPVCDIFTREEDGFRKGNAFIQAADNGNSVGVFGRASVWGVAVQNLPILAFQIGWHLKWCACFHDASALEIYKG